MKSEDMRDFDDDPLGYEDNIITFNYHGLIYLK